MGKVTGVWDGLRAKPDQSKKTNLGIPVGHMGMHRRTLIQSRRKPGPRIFHWSTNFGRGGVHVRVPSVVLSQIRASRRRAKSSASRTLMESARRRYAQSLRTSRMGALASTKKDNESKFHHGGCPTVRAGFCRVGGAEESCVQRMRHGAPCDTTNPG